MPRVSGVPELADGSAAQLSRAADLFARGRFAEARRGLSRVIELAGQADAQALACKAQSLECLIDLAQGRLASAWTRLWLSSQYLSTMPAFVRGMVHYERDELDQAWSLLTGNLRHIDEADCADALIVSCVLSSRIAVSRGDPLISRHYLARLEQAAEKRSCLRMRCSVWIERARTATLEGDLERAARALAQVDRCAGLEDSGVYFRGSDVDVPSIARLRLLIARGEHAEANRMLHPAIEQACRLGHLRLALKLHLLHAMALDGMGCEDAAFEELTRALQLASHEGWRRTFLEEGAGLAALLQRWARACQIRLGMLGVEPLFLGDLLRRSAVTGMAPQTCLQPSGETLTERERQIVGLLAEGGQMRGIADDLQLSGHTVKTHLRNIYRKLGAHGQAQATAIARARGLLGA
jgi:LuxR family maltose regulon positive regulatory protein